MTNILSVLPKTMPVEWMLFRQSSVVRWEKEPDLPWNWKTGFFIFNRKTGEKLRVY